MMQDATAPRPRRSLTRLALGLAGYFLLSRLLTVAALWMNAALKPQSLLWVSVLFMLPMEIGYVIFFIIGKGIPDSTCPEGAPVRLSVVKLVGWLAVAYAVATPFNLLGQALGRLVSLLLGVEYVTPTAGFAGYHPVVLFFYMVVIGPVLEELAFRGLIYKKLIGYGSKTYILFSALLFAVYHGSVTQLFYTFAIGVVYAYIMAETRSLSNTIILHCLNNLISYLMSMMAETPDASVAGLSVLVCALLIGGIVWVVRAWRRSKGARLAFLDVVPNGSGRAPGWGSSIFICTAVYVLSLVFRFVTQGMVI